MVILNQISEGSSSPSPTKYDVFLSFRGVDTRNSFTDHLHKALLDANINTFLDEEEIQTGEDLKPELESAIKASRASIIVLSKNYASSTWCLDELVLILELRRKYKHIVIPIFYHVEPTDVRKQQNSFGDALAMHKHRIEAETDVQKRTQQAHKMELWKQALVEVVELKGMDANGCRETVFIQEIVMNMSSKLDQCTRGKIPHIIGMHSSVNTIASWLKDNSSDTADIFTIWGMAGIGKTSLARYVYEVHYNDFERYSFIEDIGRRCTQQVTTLLDLQKHLLVDIQKGNLQKLHDVNWCTNKIENALLHKRTFLVLDGIDNFDQLDVLVGTKGFHPGSKIIITTIDGSLTEKSGLFGKNMSLKHMKHLLEGLDETESLQLLCWHAFRCNDPMEEYQELSRKIVKHCGGHPLALKVIGSSLLNEDVVAWEDAIEFLEKEPNPDIQKFLQISYDSLRSENEKELFKHVACFFVGKDREFTETILKECGIKTTCGFSKLIDRCLVTVGPRNELMMHQLLQDMGRDLVRHESPKKPWKRSRLWHHDESYDVLKQNKGTNKIQGLVLAKKVVENDTLGGTNTSAKELPQIYRLCNFFLKIWCLFVWAFLLCFSHHDKVELRTISLSKMDKLRILQLNYVQLHGSYKHFPKGLRWLSMHGFPLSYIPFDLQMEKMVALDMSYSNLQQLWKKPKLLPSLKILNLSFSKIVRIRDFSWLPALERLILTKCVNLVEVCESIELCSKLVILDLSYCIKLKRLPRSMRKLKNIRILSVGGCTNLCEYPCHIGDMKSLEVLNAKEFSINSQSSSSAIVDVIQKSLKGFSLSNSLVRLSLKNNNLSNELFPMDFSILSKLKVLNLSWNPVTSLNVRNLSRLEVLCLEGCHSLKYVSGIPSMIAYLDVHSCTSLQKLEYDHVTKTKIISLSSVSVVEIESMRKVQPLEQVSEEIMRNLGWKDLVHVKNQKVHIIDGIRWDRPQKLKVQMLYELGIFSTLFRQREIPEWFSQRSKGPSITFVVPSSPCNLWGLNVGYVYTYSQYDEWVDTIRNKTKNLHRIYFPNLQVVRVDDDEESIVCIRHWVIANNEIEGGDEVTIDIALPKGNGVMVTECGINLVYDNKDDYDNSFVVYRSWK